MTQRTTASLDTVVLRDLLIRHFFRKSDQITLRAMRAQSIHAISDEARKCEELSGVDAGQHAMIPDRGQRHAGNASALRAVRCTAELAGRDPGFQVRGNSQRCTSEDALAGRCRRVPEFLEQTRRHLHQRVSGL